MPLKFGEKEISNRDIVKEGLGFIFGVSVGFVVKQIVENTTDEPETRYQAAKQYLGAVALGMIAKEAVQTTINNRVDMVFDMGKGLKSGVKDGLMDHELKTIIEEAKEEDK